MFYILQLAGIAMAKGLLAYTPILDTNSEKIAFKQVNTSRQISVQDKTVDTNGIINNSTYDINDNYFNYIFGLSADSSRVQNADRDFLKNGQIPNLVNVFYGSPADFYTKLSKDDLDLGITDFISYQGHANFSSRTLQINMGFNQNEFKNILPNLFELYDLFKRNQSIDVQINGLMPRIMKLPQTYFEVSLDGLTGNLNGKVFSESDLASLFGIFEFTNVLVGLFQKGGLTMSFSSSSILLNTITKFACSNSTLSITANSSLVFFANWNVTSLDQIQIKPAGGEISFIGAGFQLKPQMINFDESPLSPSNWQLILQLILFVLMIMTLAFFSYRRSKNLANHPDSFFQQYSLINPNDRADVFLAAYRPMTEFTILSLAQVSRLPESMINADKKISMLLIRQFDDFPFRGNMPSVNIGPMNQLTGKQYVSFDTNQECSIQCNVPLMPHIFTEKSPTPPPSFGEDEVLIQSYYEIKVVKIDENTRFAYGFSTCPSVPFRLPGYDPQSIGYHSNGSVFLNNRQSGTPCGTGIKQGDTVGIGYRVIEIQEINDHTLLELVFFFTHNGTRIGDEFEAGGFYPDQIYPTIGTDGNCEIEVSFGNLDTVFYPEVDFPMVPDQAQLNSLSPRRTVSNLTIS